MKVLIGVLIVIIFVLLFLLMKSRVKTVGCIRINTSDPEKDVYSLELDVPFGELDYQKKVIFTIAKE